MKTEKMTVDINGEEKPVIITEYSGRAWKELQETILTDTTITAAGQVSGLKGKDAMNLMVKELEKGIKVYPDGINTIDEFLNVVSAKDIQKVLSRIRALNRLEEATKKKSEP